MRVRLSIILLIASVSFSCSKSVEQPSFDPPLVVEGWIESGKTPVVMLTSGIEASPEKRTYESLTDEVLRYAKVSIEHNGRIYPLSSRLSDEFTLQNYYTTGDLRGEVGQTYRLDVEWNGKKASAVTTIPEPVPIQSLEVAPVGSGDSLFVFKAKLKNKLPEIGYYKFFTRIANRRPGFFPALMGTFSNLDRTDPIEYTVQGGLEFFDENGLAYFHRHDTVSVKLATMEEPLFRFWREVEQNALCAVLPAVTFNSNIPSNVEGAKGYWAGYGITEETLCVE